MDTIHLIHQSTSNEHYTPPKYLDAARAVLGAFDLDPASCEIANNHVKASEYITQDQDGLKQRWQGRVWCNPPYGRTAGKSNQQRWSAKLMREYRAGHVHAAILLVTSATSEKWFQPLWTYPLCLTDHRIKFLDATGRPQNGNTKGSAFVYFGPDVATFQAVFSEFGPVLDPAFIAYHTHPQLELLAA